FARRARLVDVDPDHVEGDAQARQQGTPAGRLGGKMQHRTRIPAGSAVPAGGVPATPFRLTGRSPEPDDPSATAPETRMSRIAAQLVLAAGLAAGTIAMMTSAHAQTPAQPIAATDGTLLSVSARAEASRVPDVASLSTGVVTQAADANAALKANSAQMAKVVAAI